MEPAELVIGILGLAGLVGACIGAVNVVRTFLSFDADSRAMNARFASAQLHFELWRQHARSGRDTRQAPGDRQVTVMVQRVVLVVESLCGVSAADPCSARPLGPLRLATTSFEAPAGSWLGSFGAGQIALGK